MQFSSNLTIHHPSFAGEIGVARRDITPPAGIYSRNWGIAQHDVAEGVHRPLSLTAVTLAHRTDRPFVLASLDLGWWRSPEEEWAFRGELLRQLSLDRARLIIHLTHTHAGPSISLSAMGKPGGDRIQPYVEATRAALGEAVEEALSTSRSATLDWHTGRCSLACHRDQPSPTDAGVIVGYVPRLRVDDTVLVGRVTDSLGVTLATLVNYACHPTTLAWENRLISPDYIGAMREIVERDTDGAPCLFLQGASGELAPRRQYVGDTKVADQNGRQLGYAVLATLADMLPSRQALQFAGVEASAAPLGCWKLSPYVPDENASENLVEIDLPLRAPPTTAINVLAESAWDRATIERTERLTQRWTGIRASDGSKVAIWLWRLGDTIVVGIPGEMHSPFQIELRRQFSDHAVVVVNIANGSLGYLPPSADYSLHTYQCDVSLFQAGAYEKVIAVCVDAISGLIGDTAENSLAGGPRFGMSAVARDRLVNPKLARD